jgi:predicted methyltransferase
MHRFVWDYRYADPLAATYDYPISAIEHDTPRVPQGVLVLPGRYTVKLTAGGHTFTQHFMVHMDPRVNISNQALRAQFNLATRIVSLMNRSYTRAKNPRYAALNDRLSALLEAVEGADAAPTPQAAAEVDAIERELRKP